MRGGKPLAILLILSMLSACAGRHTPEQDLGRIDDERSGEEIDLPSYVDASDVDVEYLNELREQRALAAAHRSTRHDHRRYAHQHSEPSPGAQQAAETVMLLTASVFVCTFVVVVLDGACQFGVHAGYYY